MAEPTTTSSTGGVEAAAKAACEATQMSAGTLVIATSSDFYTFTSVPVTTSSLLYQIDSAAKNGPHSVQVGCWTEEMLQTVADAVNLFKVHQVLVVLT